ncbi:MAG: Fic family protein [Microbacteriaceae bacterium]
MTESALDMASPDFIDPYLLPGTGILRNLVGAVTSEALNAAEADLSFVRALQFLDSSVPQTNNLHEFQLIHHHLFQDIYDWAGRLRIVDVRKDVPGAEFFMPWQMIENTAEICFRELSEENFLRGLSRDVFVERLAFHYEKINYIHPFREGNGRVQRIFWNRISLQAGWQLDWRPVHGKENHSAARAGSDDQDLLPLIRMFHKIVTIPQSIDSAEWSTQEIQRLSIAPSDEN